MKPLAELQSDECRFALTTSEAADKSWSHARLGDTKGVKNDKGEWNGGGNYRHEFCGAKVQKGSRYCPAHHARCYRGPGKDARSLEEMIYAVDHSQMRGRVAYSEHTEPTDKEVSRDQPSRIEGLAYVGGIRRAAEARR